MPCLWSNVGAHVLESMDPSWVGSVHLLHERCFGMLALRTVNIHTYCTCQSSCHHCGVKTPSMDLCSTEEMMSVFEEYYVSDVKDMARSSINSTCIETCVDVRAKEFDLDFNGQADQVQVLDMDFGTTEPGAWSVDELL